MGNITVNNGVLYDSNTSGVFKHPAVLIESESDILIKYGELDSLLEYQRSFASVATIVPSLVISLESLTVYQQAYVVNRMMNYTQTGFVKAFAEHILSQDFIEWLEWEINRVPIVA